MERFVYVVGRQRGLRVGVLREGGHYAFKHGPPLTGSHIGDEEYSNSRLKFISTETMEQILIDYLDEMLCHAR